jgi:hypothetical protein
MQSHPSKHQEWQLFLCLAISIAILFCALISNYTKGPMVESGDFAANSLLVQDAKHLSLITGNYSRVGFNHPGPAILYVLAAGEGIFYDVLRITDSPFAGQLFAIAIYATLWLALIGVLFRRFTNSSVAALFLLATFTAIIVWTDYEILLGAWFPELYLLPFAAFALALARLCLGKGDSLLALAVSCGFLCNGHVSFVPITGLMILCALLFNLFTLDATPRFEPTRIFRFIAAEKRRLLGAGAILLIFIIPFIIQTIRDFPDPIRQYLAFGGSNSHHSVLEGVQFVAQYWGGAWIALALAMISVLVLLAAATRRTEWIGFRGIVYVGTTASLALFLYAIYGVDYLNLRYVGTFYEAIPAILLACAIYVFVETLIEYAPIPVGSKSKVVLSIALLIAAGYMATRPAHYVGQFNDPSIPPLYDKIHSLGDQGVALDLVVDSNWTTLWPRLSGAEVYAKRRGERLFCIRENWHILFTKQARCSEEDLARLPRFVASAVRNEASQDPAGPGGFSIRLVPGYVE